LIGPAPFPEAERNFIRLTSISPTMKGGTKTLVCSSP
jgi:hypothetical protein